MHATSLKLALVSLGIKQRDVIDAAARHGETLRAARLSRIVNGRIKGGEREREAIVQALEELGFKEHAARQLLPQ